MIDDIDLVALVDIVTGTSDNISDVVIDVLIIVDISNVVFTTDEDGVNKSERIKKRLYSKVLSWKILIENLLEMFSLRNFGLDK